MDTNKSSDKKSTKLPRKRKIQEEIGMFSKCRNNHVMTRSNNSIKVFMKVIFSDDGFTGVRNKRGVGQLFDCFILHSILYYLKWNHVAPASVSDVFVFLSNLPLSSFYFVSAGFFLSDLVGK